MIKKLFTDISIKFLIVEISIFIGVLYLVGFYTNKDDPLFINSELNFLIHLLPIIIITLFYGFIGGLLYFSIFFGVVIFLYSSINYQYFLSLLLIFLVLSEFWFYWTKKIKEIESVKTYIEERLNDLFSTFLLTKISLEQLERFYITKPISLRKMIYDIRSRLFKEHREVSYALKEAFNIIVVNFEIEEAIFVELRNNEKTTIVAEVGNFQDIDFKDILIRRAIEDQMISYISNLKESEFSKYLAVIPIQINEFLTYLLIIKKMPFINLNSENLLSINLILTYVAMESHNIEMIKKELGKQLKYLTNIELDFIKEIYKLIKLRNMFGIESQVICFYLKNLEENFREAFWELLTKLIRGIDMIEEIELKEKSEKLLVVLLPLTDRQGSHAFLRRFKNEIDNGSYTFINGKDFSYRIYNINEFANLFHLVAKI